VLPRMDPCAVVLRSACEFLVLVEQARPEPACIAM